MKYKEFTTDIQETLHIYKGLNSNPDKINRHTQNKWDEENITLPYRTLKVLYTDSYH